MLRRRGTEKRRYEIEISGALALFDHRLSFYDADVCQRLCFDVCHRVTLKHDVSVQVNVFLSRRHRRNASCGQPL